MHVAELLVEVATGSRHRLPDEDDDAPDAESRVDALLLSATDEAETLRTRARSLGQEMVVAAACLACTLAGLA